MYSVRALWGGFPLHVRAFDGPRALTQARAHFERCKGPGGASEVQLARLDAGVWRLVARARRDGQGRWAELPVQGPPHAAGVPPAPAPPAAAGRGRWGGRLRGSTGPGRPGCDTRDLFVPEVPGTGSQLRVPVSPSDTAFFRWRCWAADVRDGRAPHQGAGPEAARRAALLAQLLDAWAPLAERASRPDAPANLAEPLEGGICGLVGWLVLAGVRPPA
jgi:hypothetical protein